MRRTRRRKAQKLHCLEFWDSCAQNRTSEISKNALSGILGLLFAEQNVGNLNNYTFRNYATPVRRTRRRKYQKMDCQEFWDSCAQNKTSEVSKAAVSGILRLLCAEQDDENLRNYTFRNSATPVRRTRRRKSQKMDFQEFWDSCAQNKTSEISGWSRGVAPQNAGGCGGFGGAQPPRLPQPNLS